MRYGRIGLEIVVLTAIAALACLLAILPLFAEGHDQDIRHDKVKRKNWWLEP